MSLGLIRAAAVAALASSIAISAQIPPPPALDLTTVQAVVGDWSYRPMAGGSEADFTDSGGHLRLIVRCALATRTVGIVRTGVPAAAAPLVVTTSYGERKLPASYAAANVAAALSANDPLLDDIAFTRGKWAVTSSGQGVLVVPSWAEPARVIEDCRS